MEHYKKDILNKLTIVICTFNRHKYLKRTINYWAKLNVNLVILDGSDSKLEDQCTKLKNIKYIYKKESFYKRLLESPSYINTEFMLLGCDDEFYLPSSICSCIHFLLKEPSFSSCGGRAIGFSTDKEKIFGIEQYPMLKNAIFDNDSFYERVKNHFTNYVPAHMYSVLRADKWKKICKHVFQKEYSFFAAMEMQMEFLIMACGKSKIIHELMWMRNKEVPGIRGTGPSMSESMTIRNWWNDDVFVDEKKDFLQRMKIATEDLSNKNNFTIKEDEISEIFEAYIYLYQKKQSSKGLLKKIKNTIPCTIKKIIKIFIPKNYVYKKLNYKTLTDEVQNLEADGVSVNSQDLNRIMSILKYPIN
jgi:glycosyltransferase domain-containing protein